MAASAKNSFSKWIIWAGVLVVLGLWLMSGYNGLITKEGLVENAWAQVEVEYQRRADLVPQLVATVEGAADFEQSTLTAVTEARTNWLNTMSDSSATLQDQMDASNAFDSALSRLLLTVEAYPTLTATEGFQTLQAQLEGTENRISVAREDFNTTATTYNITIRLFPTLLMARLFGFDEAPLFESSEGNEEAPSVEFNFDE